MEKRGVWFHRAALCLGGATSAALIDYVWIWPKDYWAVVILTPLLVSLTLVILLAWLAGMRMGLPFSEGLRRIAKTFGRGALLGALMVVVLAVMMRLEPAILPWER